MTVFLVILSLVNTSQYGLSYRIVFYFETVNNFCTGLYLKILYWLTYYFKGIINDKLRCYNS